MFSGSSLQRGPYTVHHTEWEPQDLECDKGLAYKMENRREYRLVSNFSKMGSLNAMVTQWLMPLRSSHHNASDGMTFIVHSKEEGDVACLTFTEHELYAMGCAKEGTFKTAVWCPYIPLKWLCLCL